MMPGMFRTIVFFGLTTSAFASATMDALVNAAASFSATIQQQLEMLQSNPSPAEFAEKTIDYAEAKTAYFTALRAEVPEMMKIAMGLEARSPELDTFAAAFAVAGEKLEIVADQETAVLLKRSSRNPDIEKARAEFERAQTVEERFHKDFDGLDFTKSVGGFRTLALAVWMIPSWITSKGFSVGSCIG
jgi:hypothetical protein